jgi:hypothetical protein
MEAYHAANSFDFFVCLSLNVVVICNRGFSNLSNQKKMEAYHAANSFDLFFGSLNVLVICNRGFSNLSNKQRCDTNINFNGLPIYPLPTLRRIYALICKVKMHIKLKWSIIN